MWSALNGDFRQRFALKLDTADQQYQFYSKKKECLKLPESSALWNVVAAQGFAAEWNSFWTGELFPPT